EGKTNVTTDIRIEPLMRSDVSLSTDSIIIVTAISLELVEEDEGTDWMLIGAVAVAIVVVGILIVLLKRR
ncbi:MAG: hypothetical protein Q6356_008205, partial [Candidatus Wukongarchaeota archaeon]|nr:hypothetical protein [Candidatus Wukongarchaeota archaeon]